MGVNEEDVVNIMGGMEHAGGIKLNDHKRKLKNRSEFWIIISIEFMPSNSSPMQFNLISPIKFWFHSRFEICKKLGQGTYGKVQLGINKETGQQVKDDMWKQEKDKKSYDFILLNLQNKELFYQILWRKEKCFRQSGQLTMEMFQLKIGICFACF